MLQPLQIRDVSRRYGAEIAELRDFLAKAGIAAGTREALPQMAARLQTDSGFHRDLTSHVWVTIDRSEGLIGYPDLLGVVAVAAAGENFATEADEQDALGLLGFLMEARRSMPSTWESGHEGHPTTPVQAPVVALPIVRDEPQKPLREAELPRRPEFVAEEEKPQNGRGRGVWATAAVCVLALAVLLAGFWMYRSRRNQAEPPATTASVPVERIPAPAPRTAPETSAQMEEEAPAAPTAEAPVPAREDVRASSPKKAVLQPSKPAAGFRSAVDPRVAVPIAGPAETKATATPSPSAPASASTATSGPASTTSTSAPVLRSATPSAALPFPGNGPAVSPLKRMGPPVRTTPFTIRPVTLPKSTVSEADQPHPAYPQLKRRRAAGDTTDLVAEAQPAPVITRPTASIAGSSTPAPTGIVRPTSLGMMAANVLYSPAPVYPPAASAAHVEGEVRVRIEVSRDGSVASASVISGPPLLRDAALDAVQRWKYRPLMAGGKPVATSAMAVLDFELQK